MALLPREFRQAGDPTITNFSFIDQTTGFGIIEYFGTILDTSGAITYRWLTNALPGTGIAANRVLSNNATYTLDTLPFGASITMVGIPMLSGEFNVPSAAVGGHITLYKLDADGSTTTEIVAEQDIPIANADDYSVLVPLTLTSSEVTIKKGESIRAVIHVATAASAQLFCDPTGEVGNEPLKLVVPIKIRE